MPRFNDYIKKPNQELEYTPELISELEKCSKDFFYFCKYVQVKHPDYGRIQFEPRWYQGEFLEKILNRRYFVGLLSRQVGKTLSVSVYILWYAMFHGEKTIGIVSNKQASATKILSEIKKMYEYLPAFIKCGVKIYNMTSIEFDNNTTIIVSATTEDPFRSFTINLLFADELAFINSRTAESFWASNFPTLSASEQSQVIVISTPNGRYNLFHRIYKGAERNENGFDYYKADWRVVEGRDENWKKEQIKILGKQKFSQEHEVEFLGSTSTVIDKEILEDLLNSYQEPILYDMGNKLRIYKKPQQNQTYVIGCLLPDEFVLTERGPQKIKDIDPYKDKLYDKDGNLTKIINKQIYKDVEEKIYEIEIYGNYRSINFTGEHPLYVSKNPEIKRWRKESNEHYTKNKRYRNFNFQWIPAREVKSGDWIRFPNLYKNKTINCEDLNKLWKKYSKDIRVDFKINNPLNDSEFWWFIGIWLGDGWIQNNRDSYSVITCFNSKKDDDKNNSFKVKKIFEKYNRNPFIYEKGQNTTYCSFNSKHLFKFLIDNFGRYSKYKNIPEWVKYLPEEYKLQIIKGYLESDGYIIKKKDGTYITFVSISLKLLEDIQDILFSMGMISSLVKSKDKGESIINGKKTNCNEKYHLILSNFDCNILLNKLNWKNENISSQRSRNTRYIHFSKDLNYIYFKIKNVNNFDYRGNVYNFETKSGEFLCRNITTHNCDQSKGTGEHHSVCQILKITSYNPFRLKQVAVWQDNYTDIYTFSNIAYRLALYYNNAYLMVENNAEGATIVSQLWWEHEYSNLINESQKRTGLGVRMTTRTKPKAVLAMKKLIESGDLEVVDKHTIDELTSFIDKGNNKFGGKDLADDLVSGLYLASYIVSFEVFDENAKVDSAVDEEGWGILADVEIPEEDFSWVHA